MGEDYEIISTRTTMVIIASLLVVFLSPMASSDGEVGQRSQPRNCQNSWEVGDTDNFTTSDGIAPAFVERISSNSAVFVEDGQIVSSTTLNDITSTWESIIFPTGTNYFGGVPDVDANCQIEIVILSIDGAGGEGGYFEPGLIGPRNVVS